MSKILLAGNDFRLLATRAAVLARTKASVVCCNAVEAMTVLEREAFDLVIICHSLTEKQTIEVTEKVRERLPRARILLMLSDVASEIVYKGIEIDAISSATPGDLIRRASEMLATTANHSLGEACRAVPRQSVV
jgi:DNA-binding NarL/FixJ family response regulator